MKLYNIKQLLLTLTIVLFASLSHGARPEMLAYESFDGTVLEQTGIYHVSLAPDLFNAPEGSRFSLDIPQLPSYEVIHDRKKRHSNGAVSWFGYLDAPGPGFRISLIKNGSKFRGRIMTPAGLFHLRTLDSGQIILEDLELTGKTPTDTGPDDVKTSRPSLVDMNRYAMRANRAMEADAGEMTVIDLMILYNQDFAARYPGNALSTRLNEFIAMANQAYIDSQINITLRLVHSEEVLYNNANSNSDALDALTYGTGVFSNVHTLRRSYGADLVMLIRPYDTDSHSGCGMAWLNGYGGYDISLYADKGFSVVSEGTDGYYYCDDFTFAHELGHNMGSHHDREHASDMGAYYYSYGYGETWGNAFGTIMSYYSPTLGYFSNPDISRCNGQPCGIAVTEINSANNALSMNNTRAQVAAFMAQTVEPEVPGTIRITRLSVSGESGPGLNTPFTITAEADNPDNHTIYYKFFYRANYGTSDYDTSPWVVFQPYSTQNTASLTFAIPGSYIIVVRAVLDPEEEPSVLPIIGQAVTVGDTDQVFVQDLSASMTGTPEAGETVTYSVTAASESTQTLYYQFYYRANYDNDDYEDTQWTRMQPYSTASTCEYVFPEPGGYIVVARVVKDPYNEPAALPITGTYIHVD